MSSLFDTERFEDRYYSVRTSRNNPRQSRQARQSKLERALTNQAQKRKEIARDNARASRSNGLEVDDILFVNDDEAWYEGNANRFTLLCRDGIKECGEGHGYFMVKHPRDYNPDRIYVGRYGHDSGCGTDTNIDRQLPSPSDDTWVWKGNVHDFMHDIVCKSMDMKMPHRPADDSDYNYDDIMAFYNAVYDWYQSQYSRNTNRCICTRPEQDTWKRPHVDSDDVSWAYYAAWFSSKNSDAIVDDDSDDLNEFGQPADVATAA